MCRVKLRGGCRYFAYADILRAEGNAGVLSKDPILRLLQISQAYIALTTSSCTTLCARLPEKEIRKLQIVGPTRYAGTLAIAQIALKLASSQIQTHASCDKRGFCSVGQMNVSRLSSCKILPETACQKFESLVLPGTESPCFHAMAAGTAEMSNTMGTMKVNVDRMVSEFGVIVNGFWTAAGSGVGAFNLDGSFR
jgi:hypothetical protein